MRKPWTIEEIKLLEEVWPTSSRAEIIQYFPYRTYAAVILKASNLRIKKTYTSHSNVQSKLSVLLEEKLISYYWMGFLAADGGFSGNRIKLGLALADANHIEKFANFIQTTWSYFATSVMVTAQDAYYVPKIKEKFDLKEAKTYNPPVLEIYEGMEDGLFVAFVIGFIDGDGNIRHQHNRKDCAITIKLHASWLSFLQMTSNRICHLVNLKPNVAKINKCGYAEVTFSNSVIINFLKNKSKEYNLPYLSRKWDKIDETFVSGQVLAKQRKKIVKDCLASGLRLSDIVKITGLKYGCVYQIVHRLETKGHNFGLCSS